MVPSIQIKNRLIPLEHIALIEPFDPTAQHNLNSPREFQSRVVLIDRDSVLSEFKCEELAETNRFRVLKEDDVALNPRVRFTVEAFEPNEGFKPRKAYKSRLIWKDHDGEQQSRLLIASAQTVLDLVMSFDDESPSRTRGGKTSSRAKAIAPEPE